MSLIYSDIEKIYGVNSIILVVSQIVVLRIINANFKLRRILREGSYSGWLESLVQDNFLRNLADYL